MVWGYYSCEYILGMFPLIRTVRWSHGSLTVRDDDGPPHFDLERTFEPATREPAYHSELRSYGQQWRDLDLPGGLQPPPDHKNVARLSLRVGERFGFDTVQESRGPGEDDITYSTLSSKNSSRFRDVFGLPFT